jgi:glutamate synthase (NADPH/NADH) small chain
VGTTVDASMNIPGEKLPGIYKATDFLIRANVDMDLLPHEMCSRPDVGKKVVVIGAGDTSSDCLRTALRMNADEVTCLYRRSEAEMPGGYKDRMMAIEEGAKYHFLTQPVRFIAGANGHLAQIECVRTQLGSNFIIEADTAVMAIGYKPDTVIQDTTPGIQTQDSGLLITDENTGATHRRGIFGGGDMVTGPHLVVTAMVAGRKAAAAIDRYLGW